MGRSKKPSKSYRAVKDTPHSIIFELEEDAYELLVAHIQTIQPPAKDVDEPDTAIPRPPRSQKRRKQPLSETIDLHGFTLEQALGRVEAEIDALLRDGQPVQIKIITGKGRHSRGGAGILAREIHRFVSRRYKRDIISIEDSPDQVKVSGLPIRGYFHVTLQKRSHMSSRML